MRILLLTRYSRLGASSRLRSFQYIPYLESNGMKITIQSLFNDDYLINLYNKKALKISIVRAYFNRIKVLLGAKDFELIWVEKEVLPWLPSWFELLLIPSKTPVVVDYDDALFHRYDQNRFLLIRLLMGKKIDKIMRHANLTLAGNDYLAKRAEKAGSRKIEWLPTAVDILKYTQIPKADIQPLVIGWIGSPYTFRYLQQLASVLKEISVSHNVNIVAVGANSEQIKNLPVTVVPWSEDTEIKEIQKFDIGIMPIPDEPFERGKCGYKLIQYMACGIPVVASPVGVNSEIVQEGKNGFLASTDKEWIIALTKLLESKTLRQELGNTGRKVVEKKYCIQKNAPKLMSLLLELNQAFNKRGN